MPSGSTITPNITKCLTSQHNTYFKVTVFFFFVKVAYTSTAMINVTICLKFCDSNTPDVYLTQLKAVAVQNMYCLIIVCFHEVY